MSLLRRSRPDSKIDWLAAQPCWSGLRERDLRVLAETGDLDGAPRNADVRAATDVELLVFSLRGLQQALAESPKVLAQVRVAAEAHRG